MALTESTGYEQFTVTEMPRKGSVWITHKKTCGSNREIDLHFMGWHRFTLGLRKKALGVDERAGQGGPERMSIAVTRGRHHYCCFMGLREYTYMEAIMELALSCDRPRWRKEKGADGVVVQEVPMMWTRYYAGMWASWRC